MHPRLVAWFAEYDETHRHPMNQLSHKLAIPLILFHIFGMLSWVPVADIGSPPLHAAHLAWALLTAFYCFLSLRLGAVMALAMLPLVSLGAAAPVGLVLAVAVLGWLVQLSGHALYELRQPAFMTNLVQALVGPVYFVAVALGDWPAATGWTPPEQPAR
jgi:uncharacterized membrane protein YGL010W